MKLISAGRASRFTWIEQSGTKSKRKAIYEIASSQCRRRHQSTSRPESVTM